MYVDPSRPDFVQNASNKITTMEQLMDAGPESLDDREKWHLLTKELVQKQEIV
jgi:hypothetical protein